MPILSFHEDRITIKIYIFQKKNCGSNDFFQCRYTLFFYSEVRYHMLTYIEIKLLNIQKFIESVVYLLDISVQKRYRQNVQLNRPLNQR